MAFLSQPVLSTIDFLLLAIMAPQTQLSCAAKNQIVVAEAFQVMGLGSASGSCTCTSRCSSSSTVCSQMPPYLQELEHLEQVAAMGLQLCWDSLEEEDDDVELRDIELTRRNVGRATV
jgi:hypothetical protein